MKHIRMIAFSLLLAFTAGSFRAAAFGPKKAMKLEDKINRKTEAMARELGLSEDQQNKMYAILLSRQTKINNIRNGRKHEDLNDEDKKNIKNIREEYKKEIASVLSPEQMAKWKKSRSFSKERQQRIDADPKMPENKREPSDLE